MYVQEIDEYSIPVYWSTIKKERSDAPVLDIKDLKHLFNDCSLICVEVVSQSICPAPVAASFI